MAGDRFAWQQLAAKIRRQIASGEYAVGDRIPTVRQLMVSEDRSDNTVSRAIEVLISEGLLRAEVGVGTTVIAVPDGSVPKTAEERIQELEERLADHEERLRELENPQD